MKKYDIIYSIGTDCTCARYMKRAKLRTFASPFDWIVNPTFEERINLILNDFEDFLNLTDLVPVEKNADNYNDNNCDYYFNKKTGFNLFHDFETGKPLAETFPAVKQKYDRRIERFNSTIQEKEKVLLMFFQREELPPKEQVVALCEKVCKKFNKQIDFLLIGHDGSMPIGQSKKEDIAENIRYYTLCTRTADENGVMQRKPHLKDIMKIFKQQKLDLKKSVIVKRFIFSLLIKIFPNKKIRKKLRKEYL